MFEDVSGVLQPSLQSGHDERGHVAAVSHGEGALQLKSADECQQENLVVHQLSKLLQGSLHIRLPAPWHLNTSYKDTRSLDIYDSLAVIKEKSSSIKRGI